MKLLKSLLGLVCICGCSYGAALSVSVGFPSAPEAQGCRKTGTDNMSASCSASLGGSQGTALASVYSRGPNSYVVLGTIQATQPGSSITTVKSSLTVELDEYRNINGIQGVTLTDNCAIDCEPIHVSANGVEMATLRGNDSYSVPYTGEPLTITLFAIENSTPGTDYVGLFDVSAEAY